MACDVYRYCLFDFSVPDIVLLTEGSQITIELEKGSGVNVFCGYSLVADVSLQCTTPTIDPSKAPTILSLSPTDAPTIAPTDTPTFYPTCQTINYSWNCFLGVGGNPNKLGCKKAGYTGNGMFNMGEGEWNFPYNIDLSDNNVILAGQSPQTTIWNYIGHEAIWIQCSWPKCWLSLQNVAIKSDTNETNDIQLYMPRGGTIFVKNVIFDGNNYKVPQNGKSFW
eukprot:202510_1